MRVAEIWRYPVKSMAGERLESSVIGGMGLPGDRAFALREDGKTQNAKKLAPLMGMRARYESEPTPGKVPPPIITLEDGTTCRADDPEVSARISQIVGVNVALTPLEPADNLDFYRRREKVTREDAKSLFGLVEDEPLPDLSKFPRALAEFSTPPGTFFDCYPVLVMTTSSLEALQQAAPTSMIDVRRFRPNILIESDEEGFIENSWAGKNLRIGQVDLRLTLPCPRCVMTTVGFHDLPKDPGIMRTLVNACGQELGIYGEVMVEGRISVGDEVYLGRTSTAASDRA